MIWAVLAVLGIAVLYVTETVPRACRFTQQWRAFKEFRALLATDEGRAYIRHVRDVVKAGQTGVDFASWEHEITTAMLRKGHAS